MTEGYQQEAQRALSTGNITKCIELLKANVEDRDLRQQVLQAEIRHNSLRRRINAGTIGNDDAHLEENKISNSLLFTISNLATHTSAAATRSPVVTTTKKQSGFDWKWLLIGILGLAAVALVVYLALQPTDPVTDPCATVRCANGGNCIEGTCYCPDGYTGPLCEQRIGETSTGEESPVSNNGSNQSSGDTPPVPVGKKPDPVTPKQPNLVISSFKTVPTTPVQGEPVQVSFEVKNEGGAIAKDYTVEYWAGENFPEPAFVKTFSTLAPGASQTVSGRYDGYKSWYGSLRNKIVVDTKNRVDESNEQDNIYQAKFAVRKNQSTASSGNTTTPKPPALPDLKVVAFQMKPNPPIKKQRVYMQAVIRNVGQGDAGKFGIQYFAGENYPKPAHEQVFAGLKAGEQQVISFQYAGYPSHYGGIRNKLVIDVGNRVQESDERNNIYQEKFAVRAN